VWSSSLRAEIISHSRFFLLHSCFLQNMEKKPPRDSSQTRVYINAYKQNRNEKLRDTTNERAREFEE
jgi:hypothetical protein